LTEVARGISQLKTLNDQGFENHGDSQEEA
jgi:hypothetical protein